VARAEAGIEASPGPFAAADASYMKATPNPEKDQDGKLYLAVARASEPHNV